MHIAQCVVDDEEELLGFLPRLKCLLSLTTTSRAVHAAVGGRAFEALGVKYACERDRAAAARGVPAPIDVALWRDDRLMCEMSQSFGVWVPQGADARADVLTAATRLLSPLPGAGGRVDMLVRLVARRQLCRAVSLSDAVSSFCLSRSDLSMLPRRFNLPSSWPVATCEGLALQAVQAVALGSHGTMARLKLALLERSRAGEAKVAGRQRRDTNRAMLLDLVAFDSAGGASGPTLRRWWWYALLKGVFDDSEEKDRALAPFRARAITVAYMRSPHQKHVAAARLLCDEVVARAAQVVHMDVPIQRFRLSTVSTRLRAYVLLGRASDAAELRHIDAQWGAMARRLAAGDVGDEADVRAVMARSGDGQ